MFLKHVMGLKILFFSFCYLKSPKEANYIYFYIPLRAKRLGEFIKIGHNKISPTHIRSGYVVTVTLDNKQSNISAALHPLEPNLFSVHLGKKLYP